MATLTDLIWRRRQRRESVSVSLPLLHQSESQLQAIWHCTCCFACCPLSVKVKVSALHITTDCRLRAASLPFNGHTVPRSPPVGLTVASHRVEPTRARHSTTTAVGHLPDPRVCRVHSRADLPQCSVLGLPSCYGLNRPFADALWPLPFPSLNGLTLYWLPAHTQAQ